MRKIIYTKYSNDRDERFNIKTRIEEDENKERYVRKYSASKQSSNHIQNLYDNYQKLSSVFNENELSINKCTLIDNYCIEYQYINGVSLEELLSKSCNSMGLIEKYIDILEKSAQLDFKISDEFISFFGNEDYSCLINKKSMKYSNLDMLFSNILIYDDKWTNVDYEWVIDFMIPVDFIIFRALYYSSCDISKEILDNSDRYSEEEKNVYLKMDKAFQRNAMNEHKYLGEIYETIKDNTFIENFIVDERVHNNLIENLEKNRIESELKDKEIIRISTEINHKDADIKVLQQIISDMNNSLSFKITKPLRKINSIIRRKN